MQIAAIRGKPGWSGGLLWVLPALGVRAACLGGLWSRLSPGTLLGVFGTFPLLSSFNYGPIMKAARSAATHHKIRGGGGGGRSHPPSPPHITPFLSCWSSSRPLHSHFCRSVWLYLFFSEAFSSLFRFHVSVCFFFYLSLCLLCCGVCSYDRTLFQLSSLISLFYLVLFLLYIMALSFICTFPRFVFSLFSFFFYSFSFAYSSFCFSFFCLPFNYSYFFFLQLFFAFS